MLRFFHIHLTIPSIHGKFLFQFRFWAHFFASQNPDTRLKIFPTALKKFALRADNVIGPIEKILEALEKKVSPQNSHFSEISTSKSDLKM